MHIVDMNSLAQAPKLSSSVAVPLPSAQRSAGDQIVPT